jgi:hypothetical protein
MNPTSGQNNFSYKHNTFKFTPETQRNKIFVIGTLTLAFAAKKKKALPFTNPKLNQRVHNSLSLDEILNQTSPVNILRTYLNIHFNIILPSLPYRQTVPTANFVSHRPGPLHTLTEMSGHYCSLSCAQ